MRIYIYILSAVLLIGITSCQSYESPVSSSNSSNKIKTESKYSVDVQNSNISNLVYEKQFDESGNLIEFNEFSNTGSLTARSVFTYNMLQSKEEKSSFDAIGNVSSVNNFVYLFLDNGKIKEKQTLDTLGCIQLTEIYDYDNFGNLLKKVSVNQQSEVSNSTEYSYKYTTGGELVERITSQTGDIGISTSRDSISYHRQDNRLDVFNYNASGVITIVKTIFYNENGLVSIETESDANGVLLTKFAYRYEYYK